MFEERRDYKKYYIYGGIIIIVITLVLTLLLTRKVEELPHDGSIVEETPNIEPNKLEEYEDIEVVKQKDTPTILKGRILGIIEKSSSIEYTVEVGLGENRQESKIRATGSTIIYDASEGIVVGPKALSENLEIMFFGVGNYTIGNLEASAIVIGGGNNLKFGKLKEIYKDSEGIYIGKIAENSDLIKITSKTSIEDGLLNTPIVELQTIQPMTPTFYYVEPEIEQVPEGVIYDTTRLVVIPGY